MTESKLDSWFPPEEEKCAPTRVPLEEQEKSKKKQSSVELLKEAIIEDVKVVMRRNAKLKYLEVRAISLIGKTIDRGRGYAQYPPTWHNEYCNGSQMAEDYFQALVAWFKGGRKGRILPFDYPTYEEDD